MAIHIYQEPTADQVAKEFVRASAAYIESAEKLNSIMANGEWSSNFQRGKVVMWLTFHAVELFLKGCILEVDSTAKVTGHTLPRLADLLRAKVPGIEFDLPFETYALPGDQESEYLVAQYDRTAHERLRYPTNKDGAPWSGVHGFSADMFASTLASIRADCERIYAQLFEAHVPD